MHLIYIDEHGELHLTHHGPNYVPRYAILSHTWGADEDEVIFQDFASGVWRYRRGAAKLELCKDKAREDSIQCFWIDASASAGLKELRTELDTWNRSNDIYITLILVGLHGRAGNELDALGFIFLSPQTPSIVRDTSAILNDDNLPRELYRRQGGPSNLVYMDGVGGCGGSEFYDIADDHTSVRNVHVWQESSMIKGLKLELHDGTFLPSRGHDHGDRMVLTSTEHDIISGVDL